MNHRYKLGSRVKILWDKTNYVTISGYIDTGEVIGYRTIRDGTLLVKLHKFYKHNNYHSLHFTMDSIRPLEEVVKDGDAL